MLPNMLGGLPVQQELLPPRTATAEAANDEAIISNPTILFFCFAMHYLQRAMTARRRL
jgi:hypothetical protein